MMSIISNNITLYIFILLAAYIIDLFAGDPEWLPHPVKLVGRVITLVEGVLRGFARGPAGEKAAGGVLTVVVAGSAYLVSSLLLFLSLKASGTLFMILSIYLVWTSISIRSLAREAEAVIKASREKGLDGARQKLARIVGRDTAGLTEEEVFRAATESVAENTSDGVVAPLFYLAIGGIPLMCAYKAINTLDSMTGYKNERYKNFGLVPARLDDFANFIPARLTALVMVPASFILGYNWKGSMATIVRDGRKHPSPNAGLPEAAVAGALGVRFGGVLSYGGLKSSKPFIGDGVAVAGPWTVTSSIRIMRLTAFFAVIISGVLGGLLYLVLPS